MTRGEDRRGPGSASEPVRNVLEIADALDFSNGVKQPWFPTDAGTEPVKYLDRGDRWQSP